MTPNSRSYLNRWIQPDTIIPNPYSSQGWNRYSYVQNNPIRYNDPSGHKPSDPDDYVDYAWERRDAFDDLTLEEYGVELEGDWSRVHKKAVISAVRRIGAKFAVVRSISDPAEAFKNVFGNVTLHWVKETSCGSTVGGCTLQTDPRNIEFVSMSGDIDWDGDPSNNFLEMVTNVVHELGHTYDFTYGITDNGFNGTYLANRDLILRGNPEGEWLWQQHPNGDSGETLADMFIAWVFNAWNTDPQNYSRIYDTRTENLGAAIWMDGVMN